MDELRNIILSHLDELRGSGLSDVRYELYTDAVYRCESVEELLELAALELQLEAHEFFVQMREQAESLDIDDEDFEDVERDNNDGFGGDDDLGAMVAMFEGAPEEELMREDESEDLSAELDLSVEDDSDTLPSFPSGFGDSDSAEDNTEELDPRILAIQRAAQRHLEPDEDDDIDIDALLSGGTPPKQTQTSDTGAYQDALAELLAAYPMSDEDDAEEFEEATVDEDTVTFEASDLLGVPSGFPTMPPAGFPGAMPAQSGFPGVAQSQSGFPAGFGQRDPVGSGQQGKNQVSPSNIAASGKPKAQTQKKSGQTSELVNLFSDFSKRKPKAKSGGSNE